LCGALRLSQQAATTSVRSPTTSSTSTTTGLYRRLGRCRSLVQGWLWSHPLQSCLFALLRRRGRPPTPGQVASVRSYFEGKNFEGGYRDDFAGARPRPSHWEGAGLGGEAHGPEKKACEEDLSEDYAYRDDFVDDCLGSSQLRATSLSGAAHGPEQKACDPEQRCAALAGESPEPVLRQL
jgi:hypothetical protein